GGHTVAVNTHFAGKGDLRQPQQFRDHGRDRSTAAVRCLVTGDHELDTTDVVDRGGQYLGCGNRVGAVQRLVGDVNGFVGTHGQCFADSVRSAVRAHRDRGDLALACFLDLQRLFHSLLIDFVEYGVRRLAVEGVVRLAEFAFRVGVRHLFYQSSDVRHQSERPPAGLVDNVPGRWASPTAIRVAV